MADYDKEITENKDRIKEHEAALKLIPADVNQRSFEQKAEISKLDLKIQELKVENEILKLEKEIKELEAEIKEQKKTPNYRITEDYKETSSKLAPKKKELDKIREDIREITKSAVTAIVDDASEEMGQLALKDQKEPVTHIDKVIHVITSRYKGTGKDHFIPSNYAKYWDGFHFVVDGKSILETHRPPNQPTGHRHVTLTSKALGMLYAKFYMTGKSVSVDDLTPEDYELAQQISEVAVDSYQLESSRKEESRSFLKKLSPEGADSQYSTNGLGVFNQTNTDHTLSIYVKSLENQLPIAIIEFKVEMGVNGDPIMEDIAYHATHSLHKRILEKSRVPCLLITISGPVVVIFCGAWTGEVFHYDYLTSIVTHPSCYSPYIISQALFWRNIKDGLQGVADEVKVTNPKLQPGFPYPHTFEENGNPVNFRYREQVEGKDRVFMAEEIHESGQLGRKLVVKFCLTYNFQVHELLAERGFAPKIYSTEELAGGWVMVVMEEIEDAVEWNRETHGKKEVLIGQLRQVLDIMGEQKCVHGDLRGPNVLVKENENRISIIDFEWAGVDGEAHFPGIINTKIFNKVNGKPRGLITQEMDHKMVNYLLTGKYN